MESSFNKSMMMHITAEAVVIAGVTYILSKKCSTNATRIEVLEKKLTDTQNMLGQLESVIKAQQEALMKHEQIFASMFNNQPRAAPKPRRQPTPVTEDEEDEEEIVKQELKKSKKVGAKKVTMNVVAPKKEEVELEVFNDEE